MGMLLWDCKSFVFYRYRSTNDIDGKDADARVVESNERQLCLRFKGDTGKSLHARTGAHEHSGYITERITQSKIWYIQVRVVCAV